MKKIASLITVLLIFTLLTVPIDARAGGGGDGGSSGGSSGGDTGPTHISDSSGSVNPIASVIIVSLALFGRIIVMGGVKMQRDYQKQKYAKKDLEEKKVYGFDEKTLKNVAKDLYFEVQKAWAAQNLKTLECCLTPSLYDKWLVKIDWMDYRGEKNILSQIKLYKLFVVDVDCEEESFMIAVYGRMKDKTVDNEKRTIQLNRRPFIEYWRIVKHNNRFYLDEIYQEEEYENY